MGIILHLAAICLAAGPASQPRPDAETLRRLDRQWRGISEMRPNMSSRSLFDFALDAAAAGYAPERITRALSFAECMQDRVRESRTFGNFRWYWHAERPEDLNAVEFCMQKGILVWMLHRGRLDDEGREVLQRLIDFSVEGIRRHGVRESYTNIYLMKAGNCIAIGENAARPELAAEGRQMLRQWLLYTWENGIHEYGSPTYYGVDLESLGLIARHAKDPTARRDAEVALRLFWKDIAANWFAPSQRLGGAHSRDYDYLTGHGHLDRLLRAIGWLAAPKGYEAGVFHSLCRWDPPKDLTAPIAAAVPRTVIQRWGDGGGQTATHYVGRRLSIGSAGANYGPMDKVLTMDFGGGGDMPVVNFLMDARGDPYGKSKELTGGGHSKAFHLTPLVVSVQRGPEVLLLASADPNSREFQRFAPKPTCLLSHVVLPARAEVWLPGRRVEADPNAPPLALPDGGPVFLRLGSVAVGLWIRPGPARLVRDGEKYGAMRLTLTHEDAPPTRPATVAVWARAAEGLDDAGFAAFREDFRGPFELASSGDRVEAAALGLRGRLRVAADLAARKRLAAEGAEPGTEGLLLAVNGRDLGRELLGPVDVIARYRRLLAAATAGAKDAPEAGDTIEAEAAAMIVPPFHVGADPAASGGKFVWVPGEPGGKGSSNLARAVWLVHVPAAGSYRLAARVRTPTPDDDSFFVRIRQDGRDVLVRTDWHTGRHTAWEWADATAGSKQQPIAAALRPGLAVIEFSCREDGAALDAFRLVRTDTNGAPAPK
ncbi:MAG TPA: hypothetical protein VM695_02005 [Phycisphaerae bacterium]|nr:hypothetical protein [Phycisphaerae bacterium]